MSQLNRPGVRVRAATASDDPALTAALVEAMNWDGQARFTRERVLADPALSHYVDGWPRPGDFGVVAETTDASDGDLEGVPGRAGRAVGAAWCRTFSAEDAGYGFIAEDVPELSIGVDPAWRGRGVGGALLAALLDQVHQRGCRAVSLSIEDGNRARALYERTGFVRVGRTGDSDTLLLELLELLGPQEAR